MNLTVILLLPFDLGPGKQNICLKGETQIAGAGGYLPGGFAPQESYFQAFLTTVDTLCFSVKVEYSCLLKCFQVLELQEGIQRYCENHYKSQD